MISIFAQAESTTNEWWSKLLGIDRVNLQEGDWHVAFHYMPKAWVMFLVILPLVF